MRNTKDDPFLPLRISDRFAAMVAQKAWSERGFIGRCRLCWIEKYVKPESVVEIYLKWYKKELTCKKCGSQIEIIDVPSCL